MQVKKIYTVVFKILSHIQYAAYILSSRTVEHFSSLRDCKQTAAEKIAQLRDESFAISNFYERKDLVNFLLVFTVFHLFFVYAQQRMKMLV